MSSKPTEAGRGADARPWYVEAFRSEYRAVYAHRDLAAARSEVEWIADEVLAGVAGPVLDLCCGFGRHSLALAERGFRVAGIDLSAELLRASRELPGAAERLAGRLARADMRRLPFADAAFDAVVNLFTSFGYLGDRGDAAVLDEVARVLAPGGVLLMDLMNPRHVRETLEARSREERDGMVLEGVRSLDESGRRVQKAVTLTLRDGAVRRWREDVRMYEPEELDELLRRRGLAVTGRRGGLHGEPFGASSLRQVVLARRPL